MATPAAVAFRNCLRDKPRLSSPMIYLNLSCNKFRWNISYSDNIFNFIPCRKSDGAFHGTTVTLSAYPGGEPQRENQVLCHAKIPVIVDVHVGPHQVGNGQPRDALSQAFPAALAVKPRQGSLFLQVLFFGIVEADVLHDGEVDLQLVEGRESGNDGMHVGVLKDPFERRCGIPHGRRLPISTRIAFIPTIPTPAWAARAIASLTSATCFCW